MKKYIIFGVSEYLSDIFDIIHSNNGKVYKIYQNMAEVRRERSAGLRERLAVLGYDVTVYDSLDAFELEGGCLHAVGTSSIQKYRLIEELKRRYSLTICTLIHPTVHLGSNVHIGEGVTIDARSVVAANAYLDDFCCINKCCSVGHDAKIGKYSVLSPGVFVAGSSHIGEKCTIGMQATILERLIIDDWALIGAMSLVNRDIPRGVVAYGVPAKIIRGNDEMDFETYKAKLRGRFIKLVK
jgi:sugar O-acyltransferase (sialic acid O-acetyltransferase NeuD family)